MNRTKRWLLIYLPGAILMIAGFLYFENNAIGVTTYRLISDKLPQDMRSYRIVHLSDLQSKEFGKDQRPLLRKVEKLKPDMIVMSGDLVDSVHFNEEASMTMMLGMAEIAPVYFAVGNHEYGVRAYPAMEKRLIEGGIRVLRNEHEIISAGGGSIAVLGVDDPIFNRDGDGDVDKMNSHLSQALEGLEQPDMYTVLISHRPELFHVYAEHGIDLGLTGHAHGGQIRIPFVGGMYSPGQGAWPKLAEGVHRDGDSVLVVSRGLGNSVFRQRLFNRPEIVLVELSHGEPRQE